MMKQLITFILALIATTTLSAQTTAEWVFDTGASAQTATISENGVFSANYVKLSNMIYQGTRTVAGIKQTLLQPTINVRNVSSSSYADFILIPKAGVTFTPTNLSFYSSRFGTSGGRIDYVLESGETSVTVGTGLNPERDNVSYIDAAVTGISATSSAPLHLKMYIYDLAVNKQVGFAHVKITGNVGGEAIGQDQMCSISVIISPEGAATVTQDPVGESLVQYTPLTFSATVNEGYRFLGWMDAGGNTLSTEKRFDITLTEDSEITLSCMQLPVMDRGCYNFIVPDDGNMKEALAAANERANANERYRIFIRRGDHQMPASTTETSLGSDGVNYPSPNNYIEKSNISIIGEDYLTTSFRNTLPQTYINNSNGTQTHPLEANKPDALTINGGVTGTYFQGVTVKSDMKDATGRNAALKDYGNHTIFKDASLWGYQDTYVSNNSNGYFYFEGGMLRGATDYLCGSGNVYYNGVELQICSTTGGILTAPCGGATLGYVFKDCHITGSAAIDGKYALGRPWGNGTPQCYYIDTKMDVTPSTLGWNEMGTGYPKRFAEYNSCKSNGTAVSLTGRKTTFASTHTNTPVLTAEEAAAMTLAATVGGSDHWDPTLYTAQAAAPQDVAIEGNTISWTASENAIGYAICIDDSVAYFTCNTSYELPEVIAGSRYSVRAANEMGGLGEPSVAVIPTAIVNVRNSDDKDAESSIAYNIAGQRVGKGSKGIVIIVNKKVF